MEIVLQCDCGFEARADDENGLVAEVQRHAREVHGMALSHDEAQLLALRAQPAEEASLAVTDQINQSKEEP